MSARMRNRALSAGAIGLALSEWLDERYHLPPHAIPQYDAIRPEEAAEALRSEWRLGSEPINNMIHLLEAHGVHVFSLPKDCIDVDAYSFWNDERPHVFLNTGKSAERSRFDAAHELGHLVLHWRGTDRGRESEREAQAFGAAFLMPAESVRANAASARTIPQLIRAKQRWNVSLAALTHRLHALELMSDWDYRSLFIQLSGLGYRTAEPDSRPAESSQVLAQVVQLLRKHDQSLRDVATALHVEFTDLQDLVFGLTPTSIEGDAVYEDDHTHGLPTVESHLRVVAYPDYGTG